MISNNYKKYKILHVSNFLSQHGYTKSVVEDLADKLEQYGLITYRVSNKINPILRLFDMIYQIFKLRKKIDIAHVAVFSGRAFIWAEVSTWLLHKLHIPVILSLHGGNLPSFSQKHSNRVKNLFKKANIIVSPSNYLIDKLSYFNKNIKLIHNPIDLKRFKYRKRNIIKPRLIWVRSFHQIYNPQLAIEVMKLLKENIPEVQLIMIGPGKGDGSLQKTKHLIQYYKLQKNVKIIDVVHNSKIPIFLDNADIFINTTNYDNTPISVLEAMACGLCIVSTNVGGIPYLLENGKDSLLVPPNSPERMSKEIMKLIKNVNFASNITNNARRKVENFKYEQIIKKWINLFNKLIISNNK